MDSMEEISPHKRRRTPSPPPGSKGKATTGGSPPGRDGASGDPAADGRGCCGICLTEEGRSIRGRIDSCDHHFCFVCIMEWAKIESRCPLCKQRFGSIRRPPVEGAFILERVVHVPVRDQVHHLFGNATGGDPYADVTCSACHSSSDEDLLLLCDLCDAAVHTYCVGLGFTVPEGDWYCHDCIILRNEHSKMQDDDCCSSEDLDRTSRTTIEDGSPVSIFEIVRNETSSNLFSKSGVRVIGRGTNDVKTTPDRCIARKESQGRAAVRRNSQGNARHSDDIASLLAPVRESAYTFPKSKLAELSARTLHQCRDLHQRIRVLRENWYALRSGSLNFRSSLVSSGASTSRERNCKGKTSSMSRQLNYHYSVDNEEVTAGSGVSSEMGSCTNSHDVSKAWKMMEIAKSMERVQHGAKSGHQSPRFCGKQNICENEVLEHRVLQGISVRQSPSYPGGWNIPENKTHENRLFGDAGSGKHPSQNSFETVKEKCKCPYSEKKRPYEHAMKEMEHYDKESLSSAWQDLKSRREICHEKEGHAFLHDIYDTSSLVRQSDLRACSGSSNFFQPGTFSSSPSEKECAEYVVCKMLPTNVKSVLVKKGDENSMRISDSAKSEIQSLVKLNLKLQRRGSHLGLCGISTLNAQVLLMCDEDCHCSLYHRLTLSEGLDFGC
uniref:PHD and RING finger domain-containing protein 1 n=1 Tax=Anthurium amnicola TaxID=1678845 RepID=A0A1D1Y212_9ARAE